MVVVEVDQCEVLLELRLLKVVLHSKENSTAQHCHCRREQRCTVGVDMLQSRYLHSTQPPHTRTQTQHSTCVSVTHAVMDLYNTRKGYSGCTHRGVVCGTWYASVSSWSSVPARVLSRFNRRHSA